MVHKMRQTVQSMVDKMGLRVSRVRQDSVQSMVNGIDCTEYDGQNVTDSGQSMLDKVG